MKKSLLFGAGQGPRLAVLERIKRCGAGIGVKDLSAMMGMSYMGVKAHCQALVAEGYLTTRRGPSSKGRPLLLHALTERGEALFASDRGGIPLALLEGASALWGESAPQKLLLTVFRGMGERYCSRIKGADSEVRLKEFTKLRDAEGRMCEACVLPGRKGWELRESHNPMASLMQKYPGAGIMEESMVAEVLGMSVRRREEGGVTLFLLSRQGM